MLADFADHSCLKNMKPELSTSIYNHPGNPKLAIRVCLIFLLSVPIFLILLLTHLQNDIVYKHIVQWNLAHTKRGPKVNFGTRFMI